MSNRQFVPTSRLFSLVVLALLLGALQTAVPQAANAQTAPDLSFEAPQPSLPAGVDTALTPGTDPMDYPTAPGEITSPLGGFQGVDFDDNATYTGFYSIPPDPIAAAGPNHLVSVVNTMVAWYNKSGGSPSIQGLSTFFSSLSPLTLTFDPKVLYDQYNQRFVVVTLERTPPPSATSRIFLAVSDDSNPNGTWYFQQINSLISISSVNYWADYPGFAVGQNAIYITANMYDFATPTANYGGVRLWIIDKGDGSGGLYDGGTSSVTVHDPPAAAGGLAGATTTQPAHTFGALPGNTGTYLVQYSGWSGGGTEFVAVYRVDDPLGTPSFNHQFVSLGNIDNVSSGLPPLPDAPQLGSMTNIEVNDRRALNAVWRNNSLYLATTVLPPSGTNSGQTTAYWIELDTTTPGTITVVQQGEIGGEDIASGAYTFFPAVMVDDVGNVGIGFSASASTIYGGAYATRHHVADAPGTVRATETIAAGLDYYVRFFSGPRNRWGDYSGLALDPADGTFWAFNEYADTRGTIIFPSPDDGRWATAFGNFSILDYGDAPDPTYPTLLASDGARHIMDGLTFLGAAVDEDADGQPTAAATGDDVDAAGDDEDGVTFTSLLSPGTMANVAVTASASGLLNAWIDFNGDGDWADLGEQIFTDQALTPGLNNLSFTIPGNAQTGIQTVSRFRFSTLGGLAFVGLAPDGEVEDHTVDIAELDFGDAPDPTYPTLLASNGARHSFFPGLVLGMLVDTESDGQPTALADGDDLNGVPDDEDGVVFTTNLQPGAAANANVTTNGMGLLNAWIDFNADGDWADAGEQIAANVPLIAGVNPLPFPVPPGATPGTTYARFRLNTAGGLSYNGPAADGEVEDYLVTIDQPDQDFGDAPDPTYPTLLANNGARHIPTGLYMGAGVDSELDGQPTALATGDDTAGSDDEDGVTFTSLLVTCETAGVDVVASASGLLNAWVDFNVDGDWADAGEQVFTDTAVITGTNSLTFGVPCTAAPTSLTFARFRLDTAGGLSYDGRALDGEVEDYAVEINGLDFGDAPDPTYPTLLANNGARHILGTGPFLGIAVDFESDGQHTAAADGDDNDGNDDEDGVAFTSTFKPGQTATQNIVATAPGLLNAWIDFNGDGDWADAGEQIFTDTALVAGVNALGFAVPATATPGNTYIRFRFDTGGGLSYDGLAADGEVEDYQILIAQPDRDFGDAPDPTYPTLLASNGARHILPSSLFLGAGVDVDPDGQHTAGADGDDLDGNDDEDGVVFSAPLFIGQTGSISVTASAPGLLNAWIDFNADGDWADPGEQIFTDTALAAGLNVLGLPIPATAAPGATVARFRVDTAGGLSYVGQALDGEVEDYALMINGTDFGDAPDPTYPTLLANNGARHILGSGVYLGASADHEPDGQHTAAADGDDADGSDDEDGVTFGTPLVAGQTVAVTVTAGTSGLLNAWVDFNLDGDWADPGEQVFVDTALAPGVNGLNIPVPAGATLGSSYARFRFDTAGGLTYTGQAPDGEVEDYAIPIVATATPPVALDDVYTTTANVPLVVPVPGVLANDTDAEGDPLTAIVDTLPVTGTLALSPDGSFVYTPTLDFSGVVTFTYHANDGYLDSNVATATLVVVPAQTQFLIYLPVVTRTEPVAPAAACATWLWACSGRPQPVSLGPPATDQD